MIALTTLALIGYLNYWSMNFSGGASSEQHGDLSSLYSFTVVATNLLFSVLVVGLFVSHWALKKENKRLKSKLESQED